MERTELLAQITILAEQKLITEDDLLKAFYRSQEPTKTATISEALFAKPNFYLAILGIFLGSVAISMGLLIVLWQYWASLHAIVKIFLSLGTGIAAYVASLLINRDKGLAILDDGLCFISGCIMPVGLYILLTVPSLYSMHYANTNAIFSIISFILLSLYGITYLIHVADTLLILSTVYATWFFFSFTSFLYAHMRLLQSFNYHSFFYYRVLIVGIVYMLFSYLLFCKQKKTLSSAFFIVGNFIFLYAALLLTRWKPHQNHFWELLFPLLIVGFLYVGIKIRRISILVIGIGFLIAFIIKLTWDYFLKTLGWPIALMFLGLMLIIAGYVFLQIKHRYIHQKNA